MQSFRRCRPRRRRGPKMGASCTRPTRYRSSRLRVRQSQPRKGVERGGRYGALSHLGDHERGRSRGPSVLRDARDGRRDSRQQHRQRSTMLRGVMSWATRVLLNQRPCSAAREGGYAHDTDLRRLALHGRRHTHWSRCCKSTETNREYGERTIRGRYGLCMGPDGGM